MATKYYANLLRKLITVFLLTCFTQTTLSWTAYIRPPSRTNISPSPPHRGEENAAVVVVRNGSADAVVLDCSYNLAPGDILLHIKWFHIRFEYSMVFQWIAGQRPQALGLLRGRVNLSYTGSPSASEKYRALQILRPTVELSGQYVCKVTSTRNDVTRSRRLVVYVPPWEIQLVQFQPHYDLLNVTCVVRGAYPEPQVTLYRGANHRTMVPIEGIQKYIAWQDGLYHVRAFRLTRTEFLHAPTTFQCHVTIPLTNYRESRFLAVNPGDSSTRLPPVISISGPETIQETLKHSLGRQTSGSSSWCSRFFCTIITTLILSRFLLE